MSEALVGLFFLIALWVFGRSLIVVSSAKDCDWLAMPIGLCIVGLTSNLLYFGADLTVQLIQLLFLCALFPCLYLIFSRGIRCDEWGRIVAVCGIFLLLALPAWIGGEQYYVFRGNHWDHFNYINEALTLSENPYHIYQNANVSRFLSKDVLLHGMTFIGKRPAVALVFALLLPGGQGNIHLLAFLYVSALWALVFPAACFAWGRILEAYDIEASRFLLFICPPFAYVVGFWGQYIFDINAWSQMASLSMQLAFVFAYMRLLKKLCDLPACRYQSIITDYVVSGVLAAGAFIFYPENAVSEALFLLAATIVWCAVVRKIPSVVSLALFTVSVLFIAAAPNWDGTVGFLMGQIKSGTGHFPDWWVFFDSYWKGLHGSVPSQFGYIGKLANVILAAIGMYFVTPDYSMPSWICYAWDIITIILSILVGYSLLICLFARFRVNQTSVFLKVFFLSGVLFLLYFLWRDALWSLGKGLSFLSPYLFLVLCIGFAETGKKLTSALTRTNSFGDIMIKYFLIFFVISQIAFGAARLWCARDPNGIGYDNSTYPSLQGTTRKTACLWNMDPGEYSQCKGVHLYNDTDPFYMEYMKQKLAYLGVPYFSSMPVKTHFDGGYEVGRQQHIITDCNAVFMKGQSGKWRVESIQPPFDNIIDFVHRHPLVGFEGISGSESWGSWTDGELARIDLPQPLPDRFTLELDIMYVFGPNAGKSFRICAGGQEQSIILKEPGIYSVAFQDVKDASEIEIFVPAPASPQSLGLSDDRRALGVGLNCLKILSIENLS